MYNYTRGTRRNCARVENGTSFTGSHTVVVVVSSGVSPRARSHTLNPFYSVDMRTRWCLCERGDVLARSRYCFSWWRALRSASVLSSRRSRNPFTVGRYLLLPAALPSRSLLFSHLQDTPRHIDSRDYYSRAFSTGSQRNHVGHVSPGAQSTANRCLHAVIIHSLRIFRDDEL